MKVFRWMGHKWTSGRIQRESKWYNLGTPKSSISMGFSFINQPFWGTPILGNPHMMKQRTFIFIYWIFIALRGPPLQGAHCQSQLQKWHDCWSSKCCCCHDEHGFCPGGYLRWHWTKLLSKLGQPSKVFGHVKRCLKMSKVFSQSVLLRVGLSMFVGVG